MKKVLITGLNSYVGVSLKSWLFADSLNYEINNIDLRNDEWKKVDFSKYDVVYHTVGIAHIKETEENKDLYYKVNRDLAFEVAQKAKREGVSQFIFLSSMSVYGMEKGEINIETLPMPKSAYGKSKLEAEKLIEELESEDFKVAITRPPMVYGKGCKGNYQRLRKLAMLTPIFPKIDNKRSMIYIDNLSEFVKQIVDKNESGLFFPQNSEYVNTSDMVGKIGKVHNRNMLFTSLFNGVIKRLSFGVITKVFGDLTYDIGMSKYGFEYEVCGFSESIECSEK